MRNKLSSALIVLIGLTLFSCNPHGKSVRINDHLEVFIKNDASEEEGKKLGDYIAALDSTNKNDKSVQLTKDAEVYTVRVVVPDVAVNDAELMPSFQALQYLIKENVFPGKTVKLVLSNDDFKDKKTVTELPAGSQDAGNTADSTMVPADTTANKQ